MENFTIHSPKFKGILYVLLGSSLFSLTHAGMKWVTSEYSAFEIAFWNDIFAILTVCIAAPYLGGFKKTFQSKSLKFHLLRGILMTLAFICMVISLGVMPIANMISIMFTTPLIATIISLVILKEKIRDFHWISLGVGFLGILFILRPGTGDFTFYMIYPLISALLTALSIIACRKIDAEDTKLSFALYPIIITLVITGIFVSLDFRIPDTQTLFILGFTGLIAGFAVICMGLAYANGEVASVAPFEYVQILWAVVLGFIFFGDILDTPTSVGALLVIISGLYLLRNEKQISKH